MFTCSLCGFRTDASRLLTACISCQRSIDACDLPRLETKLQQIPLFTLWAYRGGVRDAILSFKVQRRWCAGAYLVQQLLECDSLLDWIGPVDAVVAMPSSFWGRIRGRYDLASLAADALARQQRLRIVEAPFRLQGHWSKQALLSRHDRQERRLRQTAPRWNSLYFKAGNSEQRTQVLVVDDIVTTGQSLLNFWKNFEGIDFRFLALASALH